jgi:hypothetical protein
MHPVVVDSENLVEFKLELKNIPFLIVGKVVAVQDETPSMIVTKEVFSAYRLSTWTGEDSDTAMMVSKARREMNAW